MVLSVLQSRSPHLLDRRELRELNNTNNCGPKRLEPGWKSTYKSKLVHSPPRRGGSSPEQIENVYERARRPTWELEQELSLYERKRLYLLRDNKRWTQEFEEATRRVSELKEKVREAQQVATEELWSGINPREEEYFTDQTRVDGVLVRADFHGLYVKEALKKFDEVIFPKLQAGFQKAELVVGRGNHSRTIPKLKPALITHIRNNYGYRVRPCKRNPGVLVVSNKPTKKHQRTYYM